MLNAKTQKVAVKDLQGPALDWAVAVAEGYVVAPVVAGRKTLVRNYDHEEYWVYTPSTDWAQGGPIMERESISFRTYHNPKSEVHGRYYAKVCKRSGSMVRWSSSDAQGPNPLSAAMRCFVTTKLGTEVEIPESLLRAN